MRYWIEYLNLSDNKSGDGYASDHGYASDYE